MARRNTVAACEAQVEAIATLIANDPKTKEAATLRKRAEELEARSRKMRDEAYALDRQAREMDKETEEDHGMPQAREALAEAREQAKEDRAAADLRALKEARKAWLVDGFAVKSDSDFARFCSLGLPGMAAHRYSERGQVVPLSNVRETHFGAKPDAIEPAHASPVGGKTKAGRFTIRTAETKDGKFWVAFNADGKPVAAMEARKNGHAFGTNGLDLVKHGTDETAIRYAHGRYASPPKERFAEALEAAFPEGHDGFCHAKAVA